MAFTTPAFLVQVDHILSANNDELSSLARSEQIKAAIEQYSQDLPDFVTVDVSGDSGNYYGIVASLTSWSEGFSQILAIEYPAPTVASDEAPVYLDPEDWDDDYWDGSTRYLYLPNHAPAAADAMRIRYTVPYTATANAYDIPPQHFYAVCKLAAAQCAQAISGKYSRASDASIGADSVNHLSKAGEWAQRAREWMKAYRDQLNIQDDSGGQPFGVFVDWDTAPSESRRWLFH